jgi:ATP-dependent helicase HrpA
MEAKIRRRDILIDEQSICDFYLARMPEHIHSIAALDKWLRSPQSQEAVAAMHMTVADLMRRETPEITTERFPDTLLNVGNALGLTYSFEPGQANDGATLTVPEPLLAMLNVEQLAWSVPGWHLEKVTAILRALPKEQRKNLVPVPDAAGRCLLELQAAMSDSVLARWISRESGQPISTEQITRLPLPDHLQLNIRVVRLDGRFLTEGRDLAVVRRESRASGGSPTETQSTTYRTWDFGDLPVDRIVNRKGVTFTVYPALRAKGDGVTIDECGTQVEADALSRYGILRLAVFAMPQQAKLAQQQFIARRELVLLSQVLGPQRVLIDSFVERAFLECFFSQNESLPRTRSEFQARLDTNRGRIGETIERLVTHIVELLTAARAVRQSLDALQGPLFKAPMLDIEEQLKALIPADFLKTIPNPWFDYLPRYLRAIQRRLDRLPGNTKRDAELMRSIAPLVQAVGQLQGRSATQPEFDKLRWMIEEYRVSLFAQDLKTAIPVSEKRLLEQLEKAKREATA